MDSRATPISKAYFVCTDELARGPGSTLVQNLLQEVAGPQLCLVEVMREEGPFTLAVDSGWAELGMQVTGGTACCDFANPDLADLVGMELPRPALRAVIDGWPDQWDDEPDPHIDVHLTEDNIPHVSLNGAGRATWRRKVNTQS